MITYQTYPNSLSACAAIVRLDGKIIGDINRASDGYQYVPKGQNKPNGIKGTIYKTVGEVKASLESE